MAEYPAELSLGPLVTISRLLSASTDTSAKGCTYTSCATPEPLAPETTINAPNTRIRCWTSGTTCVLWDQNDIATLQHDVLFQILAGAHLTKSKLQHPLRGLRTANHDDAVHLRVRGATSGETERLQHIDRGVHDQGAGFIDLANDVRDIPTDLGYAYGNNRLGDV